MAVRPPRGAILNRLFVNDLPDMPIAAGARNIELADPSADGMTPERQRLAEAILKATGGGEPQEVLHPMQALGNAAQQIAAARLQKQKRPVPLPGANGPAGPALAKPIPLPAARPLPAPKPKPKPFFKPYRPQRPGG